MPTDAWWVITYAVAPAIDLVNKSFVMLQNSSLLMAQQEEQIQVLIGSLTGLFGIENVDNSVLADVNARDENGSPTFVSHETMRIRANELVAHIRDQGLFAGSCFDRLSPNERVVVSTRLVHMR